MVLAHARAVIPHASIHDFDAAQDRQSLHKLAEWSARYSPVVGIDPDSLQLDGEPDGLLFDIRGVAHLFGSDEDFARRIQGDLARLGLSSRIAIAPTIGMAWACSRLSRNDISIVPPDTRIADALSPFPVAALRVDAGLIASLAALGIENIGQLLALPRASLPSRFGLLLSQRIDQALGQNFDLIHPVRPRAPLRLFTNFTGPTTQIASIEQAIRDLLNQLADLLLHNDRGVCVLDVEFTRHGSKGRDLAAVRIHLSRASRNSGHLWTLMRRHIETLHMGFGVEGVALTVVRQGRIRPQQLQVSPAARPAAPQEHSIGELIDVLASRLGADRVISHVPQQSHDPHRAWRLQSLMHESAPKPTAWPLRPDRPSVLFDMPEPAEAIALMPDHPPLRLRWRDHDFRVLRGIGPERISSEWWRHASPTCSAGFTSQRGLDFHRLQIEGGTWVWAARDFEIGRWSIHGVWA